MKPTASPVSCPNAMRNKNNLTGIRLWWHSLCDTLFPRHCVVCHRRLALSERYVCAVCQRKLPVFPSSYTDNTITDAFLGHLPVEKGTAMFYYNHESPYRQILFELKYRHCPQIGYAFGKAWAQHLAPQSFFEGIDMLIPLPLATKRKWKRGYNQCEWIARGIAAVTGIPIRTDIVRRAIANPTQTHLDKEQRRSNVNDIFQLQQPDAIENKHILLIDDVMTTGATLISCGHTLLAPDCGTRISIFVLTKTMYK